jgi:hypothetical protein
VRGPATLAIALVLAVAPASSALGKSHAYRTPGYKGSPKIGNVTPVTLPPITLGTGKFPDVFVDAAGTGQIVFATDGGADTPDGVSYCRLARGQKGCGATANLVPQAPLGGNSDPFISNLPGANDDDAGPVPIDQGNALFLVDHRFPDTFAQPDGATGENNTFLFASQNGGQTFDPPAIIGTNQMGGGAIVYGGENTPSIGTISRTQTEGTFFQGIGAGQFTRQQAMLGTPAQAYDGSLATDGTVPVAAFDDLTPTTYVREWTGMGNVNDASTWTNASFPGAAPQLAGGPAGVFVLYRDSLTGGNVLVRKIVGGQPSPTAVKLAGNVQEPHISENPGGGLAMAYVDSQGIELRTSTDGVNWTPAQLITAAGSGTQISDVSLAATADGGGFAAFVENGTGAENVGTIATSVFGTQQATGQPGLGAQPGGGAGSPAGDPLASSTCTTAKFGAVTAEVEAGCFAKDKNNPDLDVSLGAINLNGLQIIPDVGVKIGIDPKQHEIDTTGTVSVVLRGQGLNITLFRGKLDVKLPVATPGTSLFDFQNISPPDVAGFPIDGDIDVQLVNQGVRIPVALKLPGVFGGVTGSAVLTATLSNGLNLDSLEFKVADATIGAVELKDLDISYTRSGNVWKGGGTVNVPAGGAAFSIALGFEFDDGNFRSGSLEIGLPYPGIPIDVNDTPPQLYLTKGGLSFGLAPVSLGGNIEFGITPTEDGDFAFRLDGGLKFSFGDPVTITVTATGFLHSIQVADAKLVWALPDTVTLDANSDFDLGLVKEEGKMHAVVDPHNKVYGATIESDIVIDVSKLPIPQIVPGGTITVPGQHIAINSQGFAVYIAPGALGPFFGTISYNWGDPAPVPHPVVDTVGQYESGLAGTRAAGTGQTESFSVPANAPNVAVDVSGDSGAPNVVLTNPAGQAVAPTAPADGSNAIAIGDPVNKATHIGLVKPAAGRWTVSPAPGSTVNITGLRFAVGEAAPVVTAKVAGHGAKRTLTYSVKAPANVTVGFAEQTSKLYHLIGQAKGPAGHLTFTPAQPGVSGPRSIVAVIANGGLPAGSPVVAHYVVPPAKTPAKATHLKIVAGSTAFAVSFGAPRNAAHTLVTVVATDGRHFQQILKPTVHRLTVPVIGFKDGVKVTVAGLTQAGKRGPSVSARAQRKT